MYARVQYKNKTYYFNKETDTRGHFNKEIL